MKNKLSCILCGAVILAFSLMCFLLPKATFSESERRVLTSAPEISAENIFSGSYTSAFEEYATDTFPFRDTFRSFKAYSAGYIFGKSDNNGLISQSGHLSKVDYPKNEHMLDHAAERFRFVYDTHLRNKGCNVYLSLVPDKNIFLDTLKYDYNEFAKDFSARLPEFSYIDITDKLSPDLYYTTDSHWRQEKIGEVAKKLLSAMGNTLPDAEYSENVLDRPFYGVYSGQSALITPPDEIVYLTNETINSCTVLRSDDNTGMMEESHMYDMDKAQGRDAYELFLSGNSAVVTIESPKAESERELIIFRDSFGSSIAPLFTHAYSRITLFDLRYISPASLNFYADFENTDVLFLYSTSLINSSLAIK